MKPGDLFTTPNYKIFSMLNREIKQGSIMMYLNHLGGIFPHWVDVLIGCEIYTVHVDSLVEIKKEQQ